MRKDKTICIIPFFNEENTLERTVNIAIASNEFVGIVLVDDGSKDNSFEVANEIVRRENKESLILIRNPLNMGKGQTMINGYKAAGKVLHFDRVMFLDSDLVGFRTDHIREILDNMDLGYGMVLGHYDWRANRKYIENFSTYLFCTIWFSIVKQFTGERCLKKEIMEDCINRHSELFQNYGAEIVLNEVCKKMKLSMTYVELDGFYALAKQEKFGFLDGTLKNIKMFLEIIKKRIKLM